MAPLSASKQARLAKKAEKAAENKSKSSGTSTPQADTNGTVTPATSVHGGDEAPGDEMAKLKLATERTGTGVLVSEKRSRDIKIEQYTLQYHGKVLIESSDIELNHGNRYGLLAENGAGKSTFLRSLAERDVDIPEQFDVFLLNEEAELSDMLPTEAVIAHAREKVNRIEKEVEELSVSDNVDELELQAKYEELEDLDPSTFESKAALILVGLGFDKMMLNRPIKAMSGGWRMRVALARALFVRPDVLLLDEPTNHLDLEAVVWLEAFLSTYNKILVVNSHSQDFLNSVCTNMIEITLDRRIVQYGGNYDTYLKTKQDFEVNHMKAYAKQQEEIAHIRKFIASAGTYANLVKQAKSKQKIIDKMEAAGLLQPISIPKTLSFVFPDVRKLPPPIIAFNDVAFSYDGELKNALYKDLSFGIDMDSRVAIVGKNGTGKSTLLNLITGVLTPIQGSINRYSGLKLAKYSQHSADQLPFNKPPLQHLIDTYKDRFPEKELQGWRQQLGRFGISGAHQTADIRTLSDGLKSRVVFSQLALEGPHILLFDEPTNHLDISSIDALAKAINEFGGGLVLVSHDFRLISQVARELWEVKDKKVVKLDMTIQEYKKELMRESQDVIDNARKMAKGAAA